ncbi:MAG: class I SAM-dependent methyltransferase [Planctomycetota bacterium]|nr:class I SAM-dependent methyltransferase [Planctomycetota bacterium]
MESSSGLQRLLRIPKIYDTFQKIVAGNAAEWLLCEQWNLDRFHGKVIDIGCGTGTLLNLLPEDATYVGFDVSEKYIENARKNFANRAGASFHCGHLDSFRKHKDFQDADMILCKGVLHHIGISEVHEILEFVAERLKPGTGSFYGLEPCYLAKQSWLHRKVLNQDRGKSIQTEKEWKNIFRSHFPIVETQILTGMIRIPYTHIIIECKMV